MEEEFEIQYIYTAKLPIIIKAKSFYMIKSFEIMDFAIINNRHEKVEDVVHLHCKDIFKDNNYLFEDEKEIFNRIATYCEYNCGADFQDERGNLLLLSNNKKFTFGTGLQNLEIILYGMDLNTYYLKNNLKVFIIIKLFK